MKIEVSSAMNDELYGETLTRALPYLILLEAEPREKLVSLLQGLMTCHDEPAVTDFRGANDALNRKLDEIYGEGSETLKENIDRFYRKDRIKKLEDRIRELSKLEDKVKQLAETVEWLKSPIAETEAPNKTPEPGPEPRTSLDQLLMMDTAARYKAANPRATVNELARACLEACPTARMRELAKAIGVEMIIVKEMPEWKNRENKARGRPPLSDGPKSTDKKLDSGQQTNLEEPAPSVSPFRRKEEQRQQIDNAIVDCVEKHGSGITANFIEKETRHDGKAISKHAEALARSGKILAAPDSKRKGVIKYYPLSTTSEVTESAEKKGESPAVRADAPGNHKERKYVEYGEKILNSLKDNKNALVHSEISNASGLTYSQTKDAIVYLRKKGYMVMEKSNGKARYRITIPG